MQRQTWSSSISYIMTAAGATIGFGAFWRFPYLVGENGGGAYVLIFVIAMLLVGIPIILVENVIGRRAQSNVVDAFSAGENEKKISKLWKLLGVLALIGAFLILSYYMVLGGWVISYMVNTFTGIFGYGLSLDEPLNKEATSAFYEQSIENSPFMIGIYTVVFIFINYLILRRGIIAGIERSMMWLIPLLFLCLIGMLIRNLTLDGAFLGLKFYLYPNFDALSPQLFLYVLGQVFFTLSLGYGAMISISSHISKNENLVKTAIITGLINTVVAILVGLIIFPSLFSVGLEPDSGSSLAFKIIPVAFSYMHFGSFFAIVFFLLLLIVALTTSLVIYQVLITVLEEKFKLNHKKALNLTLILVFFLGNLPCILSYGSLRNVEFFGLNILDSFDFVSGNVFFVITAFFCVVFVGWILKKDAIKEFNKGYKENSILAYLWFYYVRYIVPIIIIAIFIAIFTIKF